MQHEETGDRATFRRFLAAGGLTNLGDGIATLAWTWLATHLTRDPVLVAMMPVALRLPWFLFAVPAGIMTDRVQRKQLILLMDLLRGCAFAAAALILWRALPLRPPPAEGASDPVLFTLLATCAALVGVAEVFRDTAAQTVLPSIVPRHRLESANARFWMVELVGNTLLGPALGAFLVAAFLPLPFVVNAVAYMAAALVLLRLRMRRRSPPARAHWRRELADGAAFLLRQPTLRLLAIFTGIFNMLHQLVVVALVLHAQENLGLGAETYGLVLSAGACGGLVAGILAGPAIARFGGARVAQTAAVACGLSFLAVPLARGGAGLSASLMVFSFFGLMWDTVSVSYRQRAVPDAMLGRVNALYRLASWGMMPVGLAMSGLVVDAAGIVLPRHVALVVPFLLAGAGVLVLTALAWRGIGRGFGMRTGGT